MVLKNYKACIIILAYDTLSEKGKHMKKTFLLIIVIAMLMCGCAPVGLADSGESLAVRVRPDSLFMVVR